MKKELYLTGGITDQKAFSNVKERLQHDVGMLINLVLKEKQINSDLVAPFWAFARMLFPVAESIGDLIYRGSSSDNLVNLFKNDLSKYNENYAKVAGLVTLMYRHSLTHQDEMRSLMDENTRCYGWGLGFANTLSHLEILDLDRGRSIPVTIQFDLGQFYDDLLRVLDDKLKDDFCGKAGRRYEEWKLCWLPQDDENITKIERLALQEAASLHKGWSSRVVYPKIEY